MEYFSTYYDKPFEDVTLTELSQIIGYPHVIKRDSDLIDLAVAILRYHDEEQECLERSVEEGAIIPIVPGEVESDEPITNDKAHNDLLMQIKFFSLEAIAQDYGYSIENADDAKELFDTLYEDLKNYEVTKENKSKNK